MGVTFSEQCCGCNLRGPPRGGAGGGAAGRSPLGRSHGGREKREEGVCGSADPLEEGFSSRDVQAPCAGQGRSATGEGGWRPDSQPISEVSVLCGPGYLGCLLCASVSFAVSVPSRPRCLVCCVSRPPQASGPAPLPAWRLRPGLRARAAHLDNPPTPGTKAHCLGPRWWGSGRGAAAFHPPRLWSAGTEERFTEAPAPCPGTRPGRLLGRHPCQAGGSDSELGLSFPS